MAKQQNPFSEFFTQNEFSKFLENYQAAPFDIKAFLETQRKNMQAVSEAQQRAFEGLQSYAQRQAEIISQIAEDNSALAKEALSEGTPEDKMVKNADIFKTAYERSIDNMNELSALINKSNQEATGILNKRVSASISEIKDAIKTQTKKAA
ncbi:MAG: phasin family protein [Bdellovibrionales bacterium]